MPRQTLLFFLLAGVGCATAPTVRDDAPPVVLAPMAVKPVMIAERDDLFPLVEPLRERAAARLSALGHPISDQGWPVEVQLRAPELGTADEHARVCLTLVGRVVRPQGRFAAVEVPVEKCRPANVYNPVTVVQVVPAEVVNAIEHPGTMDDTNGQLYVDALDALMERLSRHARAPAGATRGP